jgi:maleate isomerase
VRFRVEIEREQDGRWLAEVPELPGVLAYGASESEAQAKVQTEVPPAEVYEWARTNVPRQADALFIGGNGLRAIGAIQALEEALGKPVLTANQVVFWQALRVARIAAQAVHYGRIFRIKTAQQ